MKKILLGVVIGILFSCVGVSAVNYLANDISYTTSRNENIKTVKNALDDLYDKVSSSEKFNLIYSGSGDTTYTFEKNYNRILIVYSSRMGSKTVYSDQNLESPIFSSQQILSSAQTISTYYKLYSDVKIGAIVKIDGRQDTSIQIFEI